MFLNCHLTKNEKTFVDLRFVFASLVSFAQTEKYIQASFSLNKITRDDQDRNVGYEAMFGFLKPMGSEMFLKGMNFGLANRGTKMEGYADGYAFSEKESRFMVQVCPFDFNSRIQLGSSPVAVNPHVGLNVTFDILGNDKIEVAGVSSDYDVFDDFETEAKRFDIGLNYSLRVWFVGKTFFDFTVKQGFIDPWDPEIKRMGVDVVVKRPTSGNNPPAYLKTDLNQTSIK